LRIVAACRAQERLARPLILYFRSFEDDYTALAASGSVIRARVPYEEVIARELGRHGEVVALAQPGTPRFVIPLGATRKRRLDRDWRDAVSHWMRDAGLIVISVGATEGLLWEVETVVRKEHLERVILVAPPDKNEQVRARWNASAETISAAGGPGLQAPIDPATIVLAQLGLTGMRQAIIADRRDEQTYVAAIAEAATWRPFPGSTEAHW